MKKSKYKHGQILIDDCKLFYKVIDILPNSLIVESFPNSSNLATEIMSLKSIENEGWKIVNLE